jgi:hypothetical protein
MEHLKLQVAVMTSGANMSRSRVAGAAFVLLALAARPSVAQCRGPDALTTSMHTFLVQLVTAPAGDLERSGTRTDLGLPSGPASSVALVTNTRTCSKALPALNAKIGAPFMTSAYVMAVGNSRFVVWTDRPDPASEWLPAYVFDAKFVFVSGFGI